MKNFRLQIFDFRFVVAALCAAALTAGAAPTRFDSILIGTNSFSVDTNGVLLINGAALGTGGGGGGTSVTNPPVNLIESTNITIVSNNVAGVVSYTISAAGSGLSSATVQSWISSSEADLTNRVMAMEAVLAAGTNLWSGSITNIVALSTNVIVGVTNSIAYVDASGMGGGGGGVVINTNVVIVSGAGLTAVNGTYAYVANESGIFTPGDTFPAYTNGSIYSVALIPASPPFWQIQIPGVQDVYMTTDSPTNTYTSGTGGTDPAPVVTFGSY
jgi:hypothetical protein